MSLISHDAVHVCAVLIELSLGALFIHRIGVAEILKKHADHVAAQKNQRIQEILEAKSKELLTDADTQNEMKEVLNTTPIDVEKKIKNAENFAYFSVIVAVILLIFNWTDADYLRVLQIITSVISFLLTIKFYKTCENAQKQIEAINPQPTKTS